MNKVKKTIKTLHDYLGQDGHGIALLNNISKAAAEQRIALAECQEQADRLNTSLELQRNATQSISSELLAAKRELESQKSLLAQRSRELEVARKELKDSQSTIDKLNPDFDPPECQVSGLAKPIKGHMLLVPSAFTIAFNSLKREMVKCPAPSAFDAKSHRGSAATYELADVVPTFGVSDMINLGRFVACLAIMGLPGIITAKNNFSNYGPRIDGDAVSLHRMRKFIRWFRASLDWKDPVLGKEELTAEEKLRALARY